MARPTRFGAARPVTAGRPKVRAAATDFNFGANVRPGGKKKGKGGSAS